jgi:hypothetical protein
MEAGVVLMNAVLTILADRADLVGADGTAELTGVAKVSIPELAPPEPTDGYTSQCQETCLSRLNHDILCFQVCHGRAE